MCVFDYLGGGALAVLGLGVGHHGAQFPRRAGHWSPVCTANSKPRGHIGEVSAVLVNLFGVLLNFRTEVTRASTYVRVALCDALLSHDLKHAGRNELGGFRPACLIWCCGASPNPGFQVH